MTTAINASVLVASVAAGISGLSTMVSAGALRTARKATRESQRARVDSLAPRIVVDIHVAEGDTRCAIEADPLARGIVKPGTLFDTESQGDQVLFVRGWAEFKNEGKSSAYLTIPGTACPVDSDGVDPVGSSRWLQFTGRGLPQAVALSPGDHVWVFLEAEHSIKEWLSESKRVEGNTELALARMREGDTSVGAWFSVRSADQYEVGLVDHIRLGLLAFPLNQEFSGGTRYVLTSATPHCIILRTQRRYAHEGR
jgi:hypothetical protein